MAAILSSTILASTSAFNATVPPAAVALPEHVIPIAPSGPTKVGKKRRMIRRPSQVIRETANKICEGRLQMFDVKGNKWKRVYVVLTPTDASIFDMCMEVPTSKSFGYKLGPAKLTIGQRIGPVQPLRGVKVAYLPDNALQKRCSFKVSTSLFSVYLSCALEKGGSTREGRERERATLAQWCTALHQTMIHDETRINTEKAGTRGSGNGSRGKHGNSGGAHRRGNEKGGHEGTYNDTEAHVSVSFAGDMDHELSGTLTNGLSSVRSPVVFVSGSGEISRSGAVPGSRGKEGECGVGSSVEDRAVVFRGGGLGSRGSSRRDGGRDGGVSGVSGGGGGGGGGGDAGGTTVDEGPTSASGALSSSTKTTGSRATAPPHTPRTPASTSPHTRSPASTDDSHAARTTSPVHTAQHDPLASYRADAGCAVEPHPGTTPRDRQAHSTEGESRPRRVRGGKDESVRPPEYVGEEGEGALVFPVPRRSSGDEYGGRGYDDDFEDEEGDGVERQRYSHDRAGSKETRQARDDDREHDHNDEEVEGEEDRDDDSELESVSASQEDSRLMQDASELLISESVVFHDDGMSSYVHTSDASMESEEEGQFGSRTVHRRRRPWSVAYAQADAPKGPRITVLPVPCSSTRDDALSCAFCSCPSTVRSASDVAWHPKPSRADIYLPCPYFLTSHLICSGCKARNDRAKIKKAQMAKVYRRVLSAGGEVRDDPELGGYMHQDVRCMSWAMERPQAIEHTWHDDIDTHTLMIPPRMKMKQVVRRR